MKDINKFIKQQKIDARILEISGFHAYLLNKNNLKEFLTHLKSSESLRFTILTDLFATDFLESKNCFEITYNLLSLKLNQRILCKIELQQEESAPSVVDIFSCAGWYEREAYDMFGVTFDGNKDLRRILTDYGFVGHPLRKDFPVTGHLELKYDQNLQQVIYEPINLEQEFRNFETTSPWYGPEYVLPGDEKARQGN